MKLSVDFIDPYERHKHRIWQQLKFYAITSTIVNLILLVAIFTMARAEEIDLNIISKIESSDNPLAYNRISQARGLYQITPICLEDYNNAHPTTTIALNSLYNPQVARKVATWYITRLKQIMAKNGISCQISHILISYNWGIGNFLKWHKAGGNFNNLPKETQNYILKYQKLARAK